MPDAFHFFEFGTIMDFDQNVHNKSTHHTEDAVHGGVGLQFLRLKRKTEKNKTKFANEKSQSRLALFVFFFCFSSQLHITWKHHSSRR